MKHLITILILLATTFSTYACNNTLPLSEVEKALALEPNAGAKSCADLPDEQCLCYDGIDFEASILITEVDEVTGINTDRKLLRHSPVRKAAKEAKLKALQDAELAKAELKSTRKERIAKAKTIADLKAILLEE